MPSRLIIILAIFALLVGTLLLRSDALWGARAEVSVETPLAPPEGALRVFHLGHSLVGRDMPAMVAQLAGEGHEYQLQLGWGTSLREHWEPDLAINGFEIENNTPMYNDAKEAVGSGDYDAVVFTEMVEIKDAVRYHKSDLYLSRWADLAHTGNTETRIYLYESWHRLDDPKGWLTRLDEDLGEYWQKRILQRALARSKSGTSIYLIPAGQVMAQFVRQVEVLGGIGNVKSREDLFARLENGELDVIHMNDLGAYLVALTHYAVLYHRTPVGLPFNLLRADGTLAAAPDPDVARLMQETVWDVVTRHSFTGVTP